MGQGQPSPRSRQRSEKCRPILFQNVGARSIPDAETLKEVKDYVLGESQGLAQGAYTVLLHVSHSNLKTTRFNELRLDLRMTISELKEKLYRHCGTRVDAMSVLLRETGTGRVLAELGDNSAKLGFYSPKNGQTLYIVDSDPHSASAGGWLENTDLVEKYAISEESYNKRENTYRKFREEKRKTDPTWSATADLRGGKTDPADLDDSKPPVVRVGQRAEIFPGGRRAEVMFVGAGLTGMPAGWWVGVKYDEPVGKNDGQVKGVRYFTADKGYGGMVRPSKVKVGDFPPRVDHGLDEEDDEI